MTLSIWRYAHLALAIVSSLFLLILSMTGVILAIDAVDEKRPAYRVDGFETITLAESLPALTKVYPEIIEIAVDHRGFVRVDGTDSDEHSVNAYVDPRNGTILGEEKQKSEFIQWNIALHRSLFLKDTGRLLVGIVSFLLFLISISGMILIIKRQQGIRHFFARVNRDFFAQYFHVISGRVALVPIIVISLTGTYLFMARIGMIERPPVETSYELADEDPDIELEQFPIFGQTRLSDVERIEFPFIAGDPEEHFILKLKDRTLTINQLTGRVLHEIRYPLTTTLEKWSLDLHTGRTNIIWAIILGFASLNIIAFIYTGCVITFKRTRTRIRNKFRPEHAEVVILTGSENGSTLFFANEIHRQLLADGKRSYLAEMNRYTQYPKARHLLIFTSTYGLGTAPASAVHFERLVGNVPQSKGLLFSVIGFGSTAYPDFCAYARHVDNLLETQDWATRSTPVFTINDRSPEEFTNWVSAWNRQSNHNLATAAARYRIQKSGLKKLRVSDKTAISEDNDTFKIALVPESSVSFRSGDLLAVYPANDGRERLYSIGRSDKSIELMVKLYPEGLGSGYLYGLDINDEIRCLVMENPGFHFPRKSANVVMIANGTGIAPFKGMIRENKKRVPIRLYAGLRYDNQLTNYYREMMNDEMQRGHLDTFRIALSRGKTPQYVMDLIQEDAAFFADLLENRGAVMICGSLAMQQDVEALLDRICRQLNGKSFFHYRSQGQVFTDCY